MCIRDREYRVRVGNHASYDESARVLSEMDVLAYGAQIVTPSSTCLLYTSRCV